MPGHPAKFFADSTYGGTFKAHTAARKWRDSHWDGMDRSRKLSDRDRAAIARSKLHYTEIAEKYGISANYVHQIRRSG